MKCPKCHTQYSYWQSWKIWNPMKYVCPYCSAVLKMGPRGKWLLFTSGVIGFLIALFAIIMEERGMWQMADSMKYFAIVFPVVLMPWTCMCWKFGDFTEIRNT